MHSVWSIGFIIVDMFGRLLVLSLSLPLFLSPLSLTPKYTLQHPQVKLYSVMPFPQVSHQQERDLQKNLDLMTNNELRNKV